MPVPPIDRAALLVRGLNAAQIELDRQRERDPQHLHHAERSRFSQFGEDGVIEEIFRRIGTTDRTFIEIGAADGEENCTRALVEAGWRGVWVEGSDERVEHARSVIGDRSVDVVQSLVTRENVIEVLDAVDAPAAPDLLVIDVDGNDAHLWRAVADRVRARVVVIEYNATVGPVIDWEMPYDAEHRWAEDAYHGASLAALHRVGRSTGHRLVGCSSEGVNAFFVREADAAHFTDRTLWEHYVPPRYRLPFGHPEEALVPVTVPTVPEDQVDRLRLDAHLPPEHSRVPGSRVYFHVAVDNGTTVAVGSSQEHPVRIATWWTDQDGVALEGEPNRTEVSWWAEPGERASVVADATIPRDPRAHELWVGLVQEGVRWFDPPGRCAVGDRSSFSTTR